MGGGGETRQQRGGVAGGRDTRGVVRGGTEGTPHAGLDLECGTEAIAAAGPPHPARDARSIVVNVDPDRLRSYNFTPDDVVQALMTGNVIIPAGNLYVRNEMPLVPVNARVTDIQEIARVPVRPGENVYIGDVADIADATDVNFGYAMVDGETSVYIPVVKQNTGSTLSVVAKAMRPIPIGVGEDVGIAQSGAEDESDHRTAG